MVMTCWSPSRVSPQTPVVQSVLYMLPLGQLLQGANVGFVVMQMTHNYINKYSQMTAVQLTHFREQLVESELPSPQPKQNMRYR